MFRYLLVLFIAIPLHAVNIEKIDDNTIRMTSSDSAISTNINIRSYEASSSDDSESSTEQPIEIHIHETPQQNGSTRRYVAWVSVGGAITVSLITAIVNIVTHFTS